MVLSMAIRLQHDAHHYHGQYAGYKKSNGLFVMSSRKGLEAVCGLGQGRYLDRAVADFLGGPHQVCKTAVAHRKGTYILDIAFRFLQKYPGSIPLCWFALGMHSTKEVQRPFSS
jgi:hypothetical protein